MSFRYAHDRKGQVNLPAGLQRVDIGHIATNAWDLTSLSLRVSKAGVSIDPPQTVGSDDFREFANR